MARIPCRQCYKTFKNPSGLEWHVDHLHQSVDRSDENHEASDANEAMTDVEVLWAKQDLLEEEIESGSQKCQEARDRGHAQRSGFLARLEGLNNKVDELEGQIPSLKQRTDHFVETRSTVAGLQQQLSDFQDVVVSLARLVVHIDQSHKKHKAFENIVVRLPLQKELEQARAVLRDVLGMNQPDEMGAFLRVMRLKGRLGP